jgi:hypothetical protein
VQSSHAIGCGEEGSPCAETSWVEPQIGSNDDCFDGYPERKYSWSDQRRRLLTRGQALEHAQPSQAVRGSIEAQRRNGLLLTLRWRGMDSNFRSLSLLG